MWNFIFNAAFNIKFYDTGNLSIKIFTIVQVLNKYSLDLLSIDRSICNVKCI